ncbi:MAG TPA: winged helix-turn-helix transcriptional regulator [Candidatus Nanoarchaeia archaeon]|nr:winged helix-turn-helix transcriptional regulator [Candidatus Nanoarchaeia archaeon]
MLTPNEKRLLRYLASTTQDCSINQLAKDCGLSPSGAHKILKKLEKEGVLKAKHIANILSYTLDFQGDNTSSVLHLAFVPPALQGRVKLRAQDLSQLKKSAKVCILFGSFITEKQSPSDLDMVAVFEKDDFDDYNQALDRVKDLSPIKIQDVIQTTQDLRDNIKKGDPIIRAALRNGVVLWGIDPLLEVIKSVHE